MEKSKPYVLIVDDEKANIEILCSALEDQYEILVATSGQEALHIAFKELPDLILLDIIMPGMDGYEVCSQLKADPKTNGIPVIFVTVMHDDEDETKGLDCGAIDYITKPIRPAILRARVRNHLDLKKAQAEQMRLISELQWSLSEVHTLSGLLPICMFCKRIRNDKGYWERLEAYISERTSAEFTHSLCEECRDLHFPEYKKS